MPSPQRGPHFSSLFPHSVEPGTVIVTVTTAAAIVLIFSKALLSPATPKSRDGESNCRYFFHPFQGWALSQQAASPAEWERGAQVSGGPGWGKAAAMATQVLGQS